ncbi:MAG: biopolymer transport protein ExbD [Crocinitomicaceae bacterium]|jgi:biopolymer transport protein ExbD
MLKFVPFLVFLLLFSCTEDCSKCENKLEYVLSNQQARVDVPESKIEDSIASEVFMTVKVTAEDKYTVDGEEYTIDEITAMIDQRMNSETISSRKIKLEGHKMAHYEPFFKLLAVVQINGLEPVLAYMK